MQQPPPLPHINPYAAPVARIDDYHGDQLVLADRAMRLVAKIVDGAIVLGIIAVLGIVAAVALPALQNNGQNNEAAMIAFGVVAIALMISLLVVNLVLLHRHGQTIAKRMFGMRIVRSDGSRCSLLRLIFARWLPTTLLSIIPLLGYVFSLIDPLLIFRLDQRCMHDLIADTIVVKA